MACYLEHELMISQVAVAHGCIYRAVCGTCIYARDCFRSFLVLCMRVGTCKCCLRTRKGLSSIDAGELLFITSHNFMLYIIIVEPLVAFTVVLNGAPLFLLPFCDSDCMHLSLRSCRPPRAELSSLHQATISLLLMSRWAPLEHAPPKKKNSICFGRSVS